MMTAKLQRVRRHNVSSPVVVPHHGLSSGCDHTPALNLKQDPQDVPPMGRGGWQSKEAACPPPMLPALLQEWWEGVWLSFIQCSPPGIRKSLGNQLWPAPSGDTSQNTAQSRCGCWGLVRNNRKQISGGLTFATLGKYF